MIVSHLRDRETCSSPGLIKNHFSIKDGMYSLTKAMWFFLNTSRFGCRKRTYCKNWRYSSPSFSSASFPLLVYKFKETVSLCRQKHWPAVVCLILHSESLSYLRVWKQTKLSGAVKKVISEKRKQHPGCQDQYLLPLSQWRFTPEACIAINYLFELSKYVVYGKCRQKRSLRKGSWMEWHLERESVHIKMKYLQIGKLGSTILGKAENNAVQKCYMKWGSAFENMPRVQANSSWHV